MSAMWKRLWKEWTIDRPAAFGDWLWQVFVVELAALLDRLTLRRVIAFIPVIILIFAYAHRIPLPPELMLVGDVLAYIDIFSMILLFSLMARAAAIFHVVRQAGEHMRRLLGQARRSLRPDFRHRRVGGASNRRRRTVRAKNEDDGRVPTCGFAWA
jgi:hypothetical protein